MGYTTIFNGSFEIIGEMSRDFVEFINRFSNTRRMARNVEKIKECFPNWEKLCFNGNLGIDGEYFATNTGCFGQNQDISIISYNTPAVTQPGLWCQWIIETNEDLNNHEIKKFTGRLKWDGGEKFYKYDMWLAYLINNFFVPMDLELNGAMICIGEDSEDVTYLVVSKNEIEWVGALSNSILNSLKQQYKDNEEVVDKLNEIGMTPDEIKNNYFDWEEDDY